MKISQKEFENVVKLDAYKRYKYSIKRIADWEVLSLLRSSDDSWALGKAEDRTIFPIWPACIYAESMKKNEWESYKTKEVNLEKFMLLAENEIKSSGHLISVFPIRELTGFVVSVNEFIRDLQVELDKIE